MSIRSCSRRPVLALGPLTILFALSVAIGGTASLLGGASRTSVARETQTRVASQATPTQIAPTQIAPAQAAAPAQITPAPGESFTPESRIRRPVLALSVDDGRTLLVVNQRCGSVSAVDVAERRVFAEFDVGGRLEHATIHPVTRLILFVDSARHQLIAGRYVDRQLRIIDRTSVGPWPQSVVMNAQGTRAYVASTWSHRCEAIGLRAAESHDSRRSVDSVGSVDSVDRESSVFVASDRQTIDLPFAARAQLLLPDQRHLIVADAFGGSLATIDVTRFQLLATRETSGHNQRAMRLSGDRLSGEPLSGDRSEVWITQQVASPKTPLTEENVATGRVIRNIVRRITVADLIEPQTDLNQASREVVLDEPESGAGDPADVIFDSHGDAAIALSGVQQVTFVSRPDGRRDAAVDAAVNTVRANVGMRPVALVAIPQSQWIAVVNMHDDSLTFVDSGRRAAVATIPLGPAARQLPRDRGERSFFDATQSARGHFSCHSCHTDGHTNGRLADTQGDDSFGTPKRTLTLLGTGLTYRWAWNGQQPNLHDQVHKSLEQTLHTRSIAVSQVTDAVAFLHSLPPPPPIAPPTDDAQDRASLERGRAVFQRLDCGRCHIPPLVYSSNEAYDVGLADERGQRKFNPPSLRGVAQNSRFFHDNRAGSLEAVFTEFAHPGETQLNAADLRDLIRFLRSL